MKNVRLNIARIAMFLNAKRLCQCDLVFRETSSLMYASRIGSACIFMEFEVYGL